MNGFIGTEGATEEINSFNRVIGQAVLCGIDISKRIQNMTFYGFFFLPILFFCILLLFCLSFRKSEVICSEGVVILNKVAIAALPMGIIQLVGKTSANFSSMFSPSTLIVIISIAFLLKLPQTTDIFIALVRALFTAIALLPVGLLLFRHFIPSVFGGKSAKMLAVCISLVINIVVLCLFVYFNRSKALLFTNAFVPCFFLMIGSSIAIETVNILNQYECFLRSKTILIAVIFGTCIFCGCLIYGICLRGKQELNWEGICYPALIIGLSMLLVQPEMQIVADMELFERSNWGSDIAELFSLGKLPIIENLNAHLLGEDIGGILFNLLNGGNPVNGAYFMYTWLVPIFFLLIYGLLIQFVERDFALLIILFFPWNGLGGMIRLQDAIGFICILTAICVLKKKSLSSIVLFAISCAILCIYKADTALAFAPACIIALTGILVLTREKKLAAKLWAIGICVGIAILMIFSVLCRICGIDPLSRIMEIMDILMSNEKWAYANVDTTYSFRFYFAYFVVPIGTVACVLCLIFQRKKLCCAEHELLVILSLGIAYFFNFSRGIVRHNILEGQWGIILYTAPLCIAFSVWIFNGKKMTHVPLYLSGLLFVQIMVGADNFSGNSLLQSSLNRQCTESLYITYPQKVERVLFSQELQDNYIPLKRFMDATLDEDETYLDFSDETFLYALMEREKPCYINQSPSLLNSEFSQLLFILEIEEANCPYALLQNYDAGFDGVPRNISAYLVAEYIYQNYKPFYSINGRNVWVRNDMFEAKNSLAQAYIHNSLDNIQPLAYLMEGVHTYDLKELPYLWANYDGETEKDREAEWIKVESKEPAQIEVAGITPGVFCVSLKNLPQEATNILMPTWCSSVEGQDDLIWYEPKFNADNICLDIDVSQHNNQSGSYEIHVYAVVNGEMLFLDGITVEAGPNILTPMAEKTIPNLAIVDIVPDETVNQNGNYIELSISSAIEGQASVIFVDNNGTPLINWNFHTRVGEDNRYLIRLSSDYLWWSKLCKGFYLLLPGDQEIKYEYRILQGDVSYDALSAIHKMALK